MKRKEKMIDELMYGFCLWELRYCLFALSRMDSAVLHLKKTLCLHYSRAICMNIYKTLSLIFFLSSAPFFYPGIWNDLII